MTPSTEFLEDFAERYTAAWCSQDASRVAAFYEPDGALTINGGVPARGREQIAASAQSFMTEFPDLRVLLDDVLMQGERAVYHWTLEGTHAASGRRVRISGFEAWRFGETGEIADSQGRFDAADYTRQLTDAG